MKITLRILAVTSVFLMLCGFSSAQFDSRGYATSISAQDRKRVDEILASPSKLIETRVDKARRSGQRIGIGLYNETGEIVYRHPQN